MESPKVKKPIEEARQYAAATENDDIEPRPPGKDELFIRDENGVEVAYKSQQTQKNIEVRDKFLKSESCVIEGASAVITKAQTLLSELEQLEAVRRNAGMTFRNTYEWPELPDVDHDTLHDELGMKRLFVEAQQMSDGLPAATKAHNGAAGNLEQLATSDVLLRRKTEIASELLPLSENVLQDKSFNEDIIIKMRDLAFTDVFAWLKAQLLKKQPALDRVREELEKATEMKIDAMSADDVGTVEQYSYRELELCEREMDLIQERMEEIYMSNEDSSNFLENYGTQKESSEVSLRDHKQQLVDLQNDAKQDLAQLDAARVKKSEEDAELTEKYSKTAMTNADSVKGIDGQIEKNWERILAILRENESLHKDRENLVKEQVRMFEAESKRKAEFQSWFAGADGYAETLRACNEGVGLGLTWLSEVKGFVERMCGVVEGKNVEEEAFDIRVQEQLDYLEAYKKFKHLCDDLALKKENRIISMDRSKRNLELQVEEAINVLDPNKGKYVAELEELHGTLESITAEKESLQARSASQKVAWQAIENQLEDARVEFTPPDIVAEKELVERKTQSLAVARKFVDTEQEMVDKDSLSLRKLKTSNQIAADGLAKRRKEKAIPDAKEASPTAAS